MNTKTLIASATLLLAGASAFAGGAGLNSDALYGYSNALPSPKAQVASTNNTPVSSTKATTLKQVKVDGVRRTHDNFSSAAVYGYDNLQAAPTVASGLTREQVRAELARARAAGEPVVSDALYGYDQARVSPVNAKHQASRSRAEVQAEAREAARDLLSNVHNGS